MQAYRDEMFEGRRRVASPPRHASTTAAATARSEQMNFFEAKIKLEHARAGGSTPASPPTPTSRPAATRTCIRVPSQAVLGRPLDALPDDDPQQARRCEGQDRSRRSCYRFVDGKAVVDAGRRSAPSDETHTLIKSGLNEGDVVIAGPYKVLDTAHSTTRRSKARQRRRQPRRRSASTGDRRRDQPTAASDRQPNRTRRACLPILHLLDHALHSAMPLVIRLHNITKHYRVGDEQIRALDGVSLERRPQRVRRRSWAPAARARAR